MYMLSTILTIIQLFLAVFLIAVVLLQQKGSGLSAAIGGGGGGGVATTRRGADKVLHNATIASSILFFATSLALLLV